MPVAMKAEPGEVFITQYLRPDGRTRKGFMSIGTTPTMLALAERANRELVCSMEVMGTGEIAVYARWKDEAEENERIGVAENGPGLQSPPTVLRNLIELKLEERK